METDEVCVLLAKQGVIQRLIFRFEEERIAVKNAPDLRSGRDDVLAWIDNHIRSLRSDLSKVKGQLEVLL